MIIANPIYDVVFKKLMEDQRIAKFFIETVIEETVEDIEFRPQEFTYKNQQVFTVLRLDFIANIKLKEGGHKKVLIEIQKSRNDADVMRFRNYMGEQYKKEDHIMTANGRQSVVLPIVTIYMLGFELPDIEDDILKVDRRYRNQRTRKINNKRSDFIEKLTHDCYIIQLPRIKAKVKTRLDQLLSIFEQESFSDTAKAVKKYDYNIKNEDIKSMIDLLHYVGTEPEERKLIEDEIEGWRVFNNALKNAKEADNQILMEKEKLIQIQAKALQDKDKAIEDQAKALEDQAKLIEELKKSIKDK